MDIEPIIKGNSDVMKSSININLDEMLEKVSFRMDDDFD
jgi:hypothetical protein